MNRIIPILLTVCFLVCGCIPKSDRENYYEINQSLTFEEVPQSYCAGPTAYGENLYASYSENGQDYNRVTACTDSYTGLVFQVNTVDNVTDFSYGGVAVSSWNDITDGTVSNQCSVYYKNNKTEKGGYEGSSRFLIVNGENAVTLFFAQSGFTMQFMNLQVANSTYSYLSMLNGNGKCRKLDAEHGDWFSVIFKGYDLDGALAGIVECALADFRDGTNIRTGWEQVDLSSMGEIARLEISFDGSDKTGNILNTPKYCCIDNITLFKHITY